VPPVAGGATEVHAPRPKSWTTSRDDGGGGGGGDEAGGVVVVRVQPRRRSALFFPSAYTHAGAPVAMSPQTAAEDAHSAAHAEPRREEGRDDADAGMALGGFRREKLIFTQWARHA